MSWDDERLHTLAFRQKAEEAIENEGVALFPEGDAGADYHNKKWLRSPSGSGATAPLLRRYAVFFDGMKIGHVYQSREAVGKEIKGKRYVAYYSHPLRWVWSLWAQGANGHSRLYNNTRHEAIRALLEAHLEFMGGA